MYYWLLFTLISQSLPAWKPVHTLLGRSDDKIDELISVVVVSRHGVRALDPGKHISKVEVDLLTKKEVPKFDAFTPKDHLTLHGAKLIKLMGRYFSEKFIKELYPNGFSCGQQEKELSFFADPVSPRCMQTAESFRDGLLHDCPEITRPEINMDLPESTILAMLKDFDTKEQRKMDCNLGNVEQVMGLIGNNTKNLVHLFDEELERMSEVLDCCEPEVCGFPKGSKHKCTLKDVPFNWDEEHGMINDITPFAGNLGVASFFAELFQMQYCNGNEFGWGITKRDMFRLLKVRELDNFLGINYWTAMNLGSDLLLHLYQSLENSAQMYFTGNGNQKMHLYFTHHVNLQMLRRLLQLNWISENWQMNSVEPGAMLVIELWSRGFLRIPTVRLFKVVSTPDQQRFAWPLNSTHPPDANPLAIPACFDADTEMWCPLHRFREIVLDNIRIECVTVARNLKSLHSTSFSTSPLQSNIPLNSSPYLTYTVFIISFFALTFCFHHRKFWPRLLRSWLFPEYHSIDHSL